MFNKKKILLIILLLIYTSSALLSRNIKKIKLNGLKVYSEKELYTQLELNRFEEGKISLAEVIISIEKFYKQKKYTLVKVYSAEVGSSNEYVLFVDEGRLGRIIVHDLNNYYSLKFKYYLDIPDKIYNSDILRRNLGVLINEFPDSEITVELMHPPDYEGNLIQLDRELQRLKLGEIFDISFFDRYIPLNDLHFHVSKRNENGQNSNDKKNKETGYDIDYKFPSMIIPQVYYYGNNLLAEKDYFAGSLSAGFDFGMKGLFKYPPENTFAIPPERQFVELTGEYKVSPMQNDLIGPLLRGKLYHSNTARDDLGLKEYKYLNLRGTLAPEFTILNNFNIYAGFGMEQIRIYDSDIDYEADRYLETGDDIYRNAFAETRLKFDPIPIRIGNRINKYIVLTYTDYLSGNKSNEIEIRGAYDAEFNNLSVFSLKSRAVMRNDKSPFYKNEDVNNTFFKGFTGKSYYTDKELAVSTEYRFSIYQDFIFAGAFFDWVIFEPEGYILSGTKQGIIYGPTGRFLLYDQFELIIYFGFDRLFPDDERGTDFKIKLSKKW